jgi:hypothetical protein
VDILELRPVVGGRGAELQMTQICKKKLGADHPSTLTSMNNLAFMRKVQGYDEEAIRHKEKCVLSCTRVLGFHHLTVNSTEALSAWKTKELDINKGIS